MRGISHLQWIDFQYQLVLVNNMTNTWSKSWFKVFLTWPSSIITIVEKNLLINIIPLNVDFSVITPWLRSLMCGQSSGSKRNLGPIYMGLDKFLHRQKLSQFHLAFTQDQRNGTNFWMTKCPSLGPENRSQTWTHNHSKIHSVLPVPCRRKVEPCKLLSVTNLDT